MLRRDRMADGTFQSGVRGYGLLACDPSMARAALFRGMRRRGIMRVMARHARFSGIMFGGNNLRKSRRPGRIVIMTDRTKLAALGLGGRELTGVFHMLGGRSVTGFTGNILVIGLGFEIKDRVMALVAGCRPRIDALAGFILVNGRCPEMPQDSEALWNKKMAGRHEENQDESESDSDAYNLLRDFLQKFQWMPSSIDIKIILCLQA